MATTSRTDRERAAVEYEAQRALVIALGAIIARIKRDVARRSLGAAEDYLARRMVRAVRIPDPLLREVLTDAMLASDLLGRAHAIRDALAPTLRFAERRVVVTSESSTWRNPSLVQRAADFLVAKKAMTPKEYAALRDRYRSAGFKIAGVTERDALDVARRSVLRSMKAGKTEEAAGKALNDALVRAGYDPLRPWHSRLVAQMNTASAYGAGTWETLRSPQMRGLIPAFEYVAILDPVTRPEHAAMHGFIGERTHPVWSTWWPPNGYNCRCRVKGVSASRWEAMGETSNRWPRMNAKGTVVKRGGTPVRPDVSGGVSFAGNPSTYVNAKRGKAR